ETLSHAPLEKLPPGWVAGLGRNLEHSDDRILSQAVATLHTRGLTGFDETLVRLGTNPRHPPEIRVAALRAVAPRLGQLETPLFDYLRGQLDPRQPPLSRRAAADALGNVRLAEAQLESLADS